MSSIFPFTLRRSLSIPRSFFILIAFVLNVVHLTTGLFFSLSDIASHRLRRHTGSFLSPFFLAHTLCP